MTPEGFRNGPLNLGVNLRPSGEGFLAAVAQLFLEHGLPDHLKNLFRDAAAVVESSGFRLFYVIQNKTHVTLMCP